MRGYDMHRNLETDWNAKGTYSTTLFTNEAVQLIKEHDAKKPLFMYLAHLAPHTGNRDNPFQAPNATIARFAHIGDPDRRTYAGRVQNIWLKWDEPFSMRARKVENFISGAHHIQDDLIIA